MRTSRSVPGKTMAKVESEEEAKDVRTAPNRQSHRQRHRQNTIKFHDFGASFIQRPDGPCVFHEYFRRSIQHSHPGTTALVRIMTSKFVWHGIAKDVRSWARGMRPVPGSERCIGITRHRYTDSRGQP